MKCDDYTTRIPQQEYTSISFSLDDALTRNLENDFTKIYLLLIAIMLSHLHGLVISRSLSMHDYEYTGR